MLEWIKKIGQGSLLLVIVLALIGVNVKQLYCYHAHDLHWEVCILSNESSCPCEEGCCGEEACHHTTRYDFYKITDCPQTESELQVVTLLPFYLPEIFYSDLFSSILEKVEFFFLKDKIPDRVVHRELLCTYLC